MKRRILIFSPFERFWHWTQALLIAGLLITGFGMYGLHDAIAFETAFECHLLLAIALIVLWAFAIFWHAVTGQWRQYVPTQRALLAVILYYLYGMFSGEPRPFRMTPAAKHNPLQRLAYLGFKVAIAPALWITGLALAAYPLWQEAAIAGPIGPAALAWVHMAAAYGLVLFLVVHIYMSATTGTPWYAHLRAMITGYEPIDEAEQTSGAR